MDNFMGKLAQRISAQEMIRANAQADAQELNRLRDQAQLYDAYLKEMRALHLKNAEAMEKLETLTGELETLTRKAIKKINAAGERGENAVSLEQLEEALKEKSGELTALLTEQRDSLEEAMPEKLRSVETALTERLEAVEAALTEKQEAAEKALLEKLEGIDSGFSEKLEALRSADSDSEDFIHKECVKVYRNVQAALTDELKNQTKELEEKIAQKTENKSANVLVPFVILTLLVSLGNLGLLAALALGFL